MCALRAYQAAGIARIIEAFGTSQRVLYTLPTGGGKTRIVAEVIANTSVNVLVVAHRIELCEQISNALTDAGVAHTMLTAGTKTLQSRVIVSMIQTLARRLDKIPTPQLIIIDESHHVYADNVWGRLLQRFPQAHVLGVTATPRRGNGKSLSVEHKGHYDVLVEGPTIPQLIEEGYLVPLAVYAPPTGLNFKDVKCLAGDYRQDELAAIVDVDWLTKKSVNEYFEKCPASPCLIYCVNVQHAQNVTAVFNADPRSISAGLTFACVTGSTPSDERHDIVARLRAGTLTGLVSCDIFGEGFDAPDVRCGILIRPTKSLVVYMQQVGRLMRPAPGKTHGIVLDMVGNCLKHGMPDANRHWADTWRVEKVQSAGNALVRTCSECAYVMPVSVQVCPMCGRGLTHFETRLPEDYGRLYRRGMTRSEALALALEYERETARAKGRKLDESVQSDYFYFLVEAFMRGRKPGSAWFLWLSSMPDEVRILAYVRRYGYNLNYIPHLREKIAAHNSLVAA